MLVILIKDIELSLCYSIIEYSEIIWKTETKSVCLKRCGLLSKSNNLF